ncbi:hypothetical protein ACSBR2_034894 [Camellia fascicularis]
MYIYWGFFFSYYFLCCDVFGLQIYRQIGEKYGVEYSEAQILNRYRRAYEQPWGRSRLRYVNDGRPF